MPKTRSTKIDDIDIQILGILQENCKLGVQKIAERVGKGISTVHARIKSMEDLGIIKQYTAVLAPPLLNRSTLAFIFVTIRYRAPGTDELLSQKEFCMEIAQHPFVQGVHILSGQYDVLLKVRTRDVEEMNRFIVDFLRQIPAVDRTLTMFSMDDYLESLELRDL